MFIAVLGEWQDLPAMPRPKLMHSSLYHNGRLYTIGGYLAKRRRPLSTSVECFDFASKQWRVPLPLKLTQTFANTVGDKL
jgi:hypothetical protein